MKIAKGLVWSLLFVCLNSFTACSTKYAPPKIETCIHNQDNNAECTDLRKPEGQQQYTNENIVNYICTNPADYEKIYNYAADLRQKLIQCENEPRN